MTFAISYAKIVSQTTVAKATNLKGGIKMPSLMRRINVISRCAMNYKSERLSGELSGCHHPFVTYISRNPGSSQADIARFICLNKSTVARTLSYLEEHGFVKREADEADKRVLRVYPTEKMLAVLPEVKAASSEWMALLSEGIPGEELEIFNSVLSRMQTRAREIIEKQEENK